MLTINSETDISNVVKKIIRNEQLYLQRTPCTGRCLGDSCWQGQPPPSVTPAFLYLTSVENYDSKGKNRWNKKELKKIRKRMTEGKSSLQSSFAGETPNVTVSSFRVILVTHWQLQTTPHQNPLNQTHTDTQTILSQQELTREMPISLMTNCRPSSLDLTRYAFPKEPSPIFFTFSYFSMVLQRPIPHTGAVTR